MTDPFVRLSCDTAGACGAVGDAMAQTVGSAAFALVVGTLSVIALALLAQSIGQHTGLQWSVGGSDE